MERKADTRLRDVPVFDSDEGMTLEAPVTERAYGRLAAWAENRDLVIDRIREIADEARRCLDTLKRGCAISTVVGSTVGVAGGAAVIGGLILAPPVAVGGLIVGSVAAVSNITTSLVKVSVIKRRAREVLGLVQRDEELRDVFLLHIKELDDTEWAEEAREGDELESMCTAAAVEEATATQTPDATDVAPGVGVAVATGVSAAGARAAILETTRLAPMVAKGIAHGAAGIGIAIDLITLILSSRDLLKGESLEYADQLRAVAVQLSTEMHEVTDRYVRAILSD